MLNILKNIRSPLLLPILHLIKDLYTYLFFVWSSHHGLAALAPLVSRIAFGSHDIIHRPPWLSFCWCSFLSPAAARAGAAESRDWTGLKEVSTQTFFYLG